MDLINVLILAPIGDESLRQIAAISPRLWVIDGSHLVPKPPFLPGMRELGKGKELDTLLAEAEIILGFLPSNTIARAPRLKWFQSLSAGIDNFLYEDVINSPVVMTNARGIQAVQIGELAFSMMLAFTKRLPQSLQNQKNRKWEPYIPDLLNGKTLGIVGFGNIGRRIAYLGKAYGMRVVAVRRTVKKVSHSRFVDIIYPREDLDQLLSDSDFIILALPYTKETDKMIGEKELSRMKPTAFLINVGRGNTLDEESLICALKEKRIDGAGLDTYNSEPLPSPSPLWELPNVILTPHVAGRTADYIEKAVGVFCDNLKRYIDGKRLKNVVNKKRGY